MAIHENFGFSLLSKILERSLSIEGPIPQNGQHIQTTRRQKPTNCLSVFDHFVGLTLKELNLVHEF